MDLDQQDGATGHTVNETMLFNVVEVLISLKEGDLRLSVIICDRPFHYNKNTEVIL